MTSMLANAKRLAGQIQYLMRCQMNGLIIWLNILLGKILMG